MTHPYYPPQPFDGTYPVPAGRRADNTDRATGDSKRKEPLVVDDSHMPAWEEIAPPIPTPEELA